MLDEDREFIITIDELRSISGIPTIDGATVVLTLFGAGPQDVAIVELTQAELSELIDELQKLRSP